MAKYHKAVDGELIKLKRYAKWMCCDCGNVHLVRFETSGKHDLRMWRDNRATAQRRRRGSHIRLKHQDDC
jgi:predicted RNA-binding Zn-ribbon protein involved in translation (DUF1610 family)